MAEEVKKEEVKKEEVKKKEKARPNVKAAVKPVRTAQGKAKWGPAFEGVQKPNSKPFIEVKQ